MKKLMIFILLLVGTATLVGCDLLPTADETILVTINYQTDGIDNKVIKIDLANPEFNEPDPTKEGHIFAGWYTDTEYDESFTVDDLLGENIVIYAKWMPTNYKIDYYLDDTFYLSQNYDYGDPLLFPIITLDECKLFSGWYTDTTLTTPYTDTSMGSSDVILYGHIYNDENCSNYNFNLVLDYTNPIEDITLPSLYEGYTITWSSSSPTLISNTGVVTRPEVGAGNQNVTLTASITVEGEIYSRYFDIVVKEMPAPHYTSVAELHNNSYISDIVSFTGTVSGIFSTGYFLSDGVNTVNVYHPTSSVTVALGDIVHVQGEYALYNTLYQIKDLTIEEIETTGGVNPLSPSVITISNLLTLDASDPLLAGQWYTVTGVVEIDTSGDVYLVDGTSRVMVNNISFEASLDALKLYDTKEIQIDVFYHVNHTIYGVMVLFMGDDSDIIDLTTPDCDIVDLDETFLRGFLPEASRSDIILPTEGPNGTQFTLWNSNKQLRYSNDGTFMSVGTYTEIVTFTVTLTYGTEVRQIEIDVVVPISLTFSEINDLNSEEYLETTGVVSLETADGVYIWENSTNKFLFINNYNLASDINEGDEISIIGKKSKYNGNPEVTLISYQINSPSNPLPSPLTSNVESIYNNVYQPGNLITITALVTVEGANNDIYLNGLSGLKVKVNSHSDIDAFFTLEDETVTVTVYTYRDNDVYFVGSVADITVHPSYTPTDQEKMEAAIAAINLGDLTNVSQNLNLPDSNPDLGVDFIWTSYNETIIESNGTIHLNPGYTPSTTLQVIAICGMETGMKEYLVTLNDGSALTPLSVVIAESHLDGESVLIEGVVSGIDEYGDIFIQDPDGEAILIKFRLATTVAVGDQVQVYGELQTNTLYSSIQRYLKNADLIAITSVQNSVVINPTLTHIDITNLNNTEIYSSRRYTMTLQVETVENASGYTEFLGDENTLIIWDTTEHDYFKFLYTVGDQIEVSFNYYDIHYGNVRIDAVTLPQLTDSQIQTVTQYIMNVPQGAIWNFVVPQSNQYGATIQWESNNPAITFSGPQAIVTRPQQGQPDINVTLTATIYSGVASPVVVNYMVYVPAETSRYTVSNLFISEYGDGTGGNDYIEIYNPTDYTIDLADYTLRIFNNSYTYNSSELSLASYGTIASGETLVITRNSATDSALINATNYYSTFINYSGNDVIDLLYKDIVIDRLGDFIYYDDWGLNTTLVRKSTYVSGTTDFSTLEWLTYNQETFTYVGTHLCDEPSN